MRIGRVYLSAEHAREDGLGAALRNAYSSNDMAADRQMRDLIDQMKAIEARSPARKRGAA